MADTPFVNPSPQMNMSLLIHKEVQWYKPLYLKPWPPLPPHPLTLTTKLCLKISNLHFSFCCLKVTPDSLFVMDKHPEFRNIVIGAGFSGNIEGTNGYFIYMCFRAVVWLFIRDNCIMWSQSISGKLKINSTRRHRLRQDFHLSFHLQEWPKENFSTKC